MRKLKSKCSNCGAYAKISTLTLFGRYHICQSCGERKSVKSTKYYTDKQWEIKGRSA